jgi:hypothetical protein
LGLIPKQIQNRVMHGWRSRKELGRAAKCDTIVLSRAKSGRTWLRAMISRMYQRHYSLEENQLLEFDNFHRQNREIPPLLFTHGYYLRQEIESTGSAARCAKKKLLFLLRNPCDVAVSEYFQSTKRAKQSKVDLYGIDKEMPMFDFVMRGPMGIPAIVAYLNSWSGSLDKVDHVLRVRYEDLRAEPVEGLSQVSQFLGAPFSAETIQEAVDFADFENLKNLEKQDFFNNSRLRPRNPDDPDSFKVRRGKVEGYRDYFDEDQIRQMEELVRSRLAPIFGYYAEPESQRAAAAHE